MNHIKSVFIFILTFSLAFSSMSLMSYGQNINDTTSTSQSNNDIKNDFEPSMDAATIYNNHTMVLGNNVKNLVILIPNEAHEPPNIEDELRVINQPYVPQNVVVNLSPTGTIVTWFNTDIPHDHRVKVVDESSNNVFDSGIIKFNTPSKQLMLTEPESTFTISEESVNEEYPEFVMNGTISVVNQQQSSLATSSENTTSTDIDTVTTFMVPAKELDKRISEFKSLGFDIASTYPFESLRGSGSEAGGDKNQFLLVLTSFGKTLDEVISDLKQITETMPYT